MYLYFRFNQNTPNNLMIYFFLTGIILYLSKNQDILFLLVNLLFK